MIMALLKKEGRERGRDSGSRCHVETDFYINAWGIRVPDAYVDR